MRMLVGMIFGAALIVAVAYVHDNSPGLVGAGGRPMVNWDVVDTNVAALKAKVTEAWNKATG